MLTYNEAVVVGANACIDRLGRGFVEKYRETACNAFADVDDHVFCFVGVSDKPSEDISLDKPIMLDGDLKPTDTRALFSAGLIFNLSPFCPPLYDII